MPALWCIAKAEAHCHLSAYAAALQVFLRRFAFRAQQLFVIKNCRFLACVVQPLLICPFRTQPCIVHLVRQFHARALRQQLYCLNIAYTLRLHNKMYNPAARMTAKAVIHLLLRRYAEAWRFFIMKRATAPESSAFGRKGNIVANNAHNIRF